VTSNLLIPAAMNVMLPTHPESFRTYEAENLRYVADRRRLTRAQRRLANLRNSAQNEMAFWTSARI